MVKITKKALKHPVEVVFIDHAMNSAIIECIVFGRLVALTDEQIIVRSWECVGMEDTDTNHEHFAIVRTAIKKFRVLR